MAASEATEQRKPAAQPMLLSVTEACEALGVSRAALYRLTAAGELRSIKLGRSRRYPRLALEQFIQRKLEE